MKKEDEVVLSQPCAETGPNSPSSPEAQSLLPCPFCGGEPRIERRITRESDKTWTKILCVNANCAAICGTDYSDNDADPAAIWNRRTPPATPAEAHVEGGGETFRKTDFAWLIEAPGQRYLAVLRLSSNPPDFFWTQDANAALRFWSKEQADLAAGGIRALNPDLWGFALTLGEAWPREHGWLPLAPSSEAPSLSASAASAGKESA